MFNEIKTEKDIQYFIDKTNSLHDGYIVGVQYTNDVLTNVDKNGYFTNPDATKLVVRVLVTSICDSLVEIEFNALREWQIKSDECDIQDLFVFFNEQSLIVWTYDSFLNMDELKNGSYVIAKSMKWRIVE